MQQHITAAYSPDKSYTRHSEGAFLRLADGRIAFIYSRFTGTYGDNAPSDLVISFSSDEGETWTAPEVTIPASLHNTGNVMSVSMMRVQNGDLGVFYIAKVTGTNKLFLSRSKDDGKTYYKHTECSLADRPGYYVLNNDRVERLSSGRLLMPLAYHRGGYEYGEAARKTYCDGRGVACFLYSDDDGETWAESPDIVFAPFTGTSTGLQETGAVELNNGVVWAYCRTDKMYQYEFFSMDGGLHWTEAQPSRFTAPDSPLKIKRNPNNNELYAIWNPIPNYNGRAISKAGWGRTPIVWATSADEGRTWSEEHIIEGMDDHGYCYPAIFFTNDNAMLTAYCSGGPEDGICLAKLTIMKIPV